MMSKILLWVAVVSGLCLLIGGWYAKQQYDAEQRGRQVERDRITAQANQNIADRRVRDATFDKQDARQLCIDTPIEPRLEWVFEDGKSFCR